jgi:hypothetical protein
MGRNAFVEEGLYLVDKPSCEVHLGALIDAFIQILSRGIEGEDSKTPSAFVRLWPLIKLLGY